LLLDGGGKLEIDVYGRKFTVSKYMLKDDSTIIIPKEGIKRDLFRRGDLVILFGIQFSKD
jgi:hypothetical protein